MKITKVKLNKKEFENWKKVFWRKIDILIFGNAFEDEKGYRIDPRNVIYNVEKNEFSYVDDIFKASGEPTK